jgi:prophage antirepressor-like protein
VRIVLIKNKELFVAKDIALLLGYANTKDAIIRHCKNAKSLKEFDWGSDSRPLDFSGVGNIDPQTKLISESDVWRLIIKSKLPEAEKIEEWIMEEVLPSIRKTGSYSLQKEEIQNEKVSPQKSLETVETGIKLLKSISDLNPVEQIELDNFYKTENGFSLLEKFGISFENHYFFANRNWKHDRNEWSRSEFNS